MKWKREKIPSGGEFDYPAYSARSGNRLVMAFRTPYKLDFPWSLRVRPIPVEMPVYPVSDDCLCHSFAELQALAFKNYEPDPLVAALQEVNA